MRKILRNIIFLLLLAGPIFSEQAYHPTEANLRAREWFQDSKLGLFIHWGPYSVLEKGEWVLEHSKMSLIDYSAQAVSKFNPTNFDPAAWVALAKRAGMKYITITTRHHDGFAMWGTKQDSWNIVEGSPCKTDLLKLLAEECHLQDIKLFLYYSQLDWHHSDYFPLGTTGHETGRPLKGKFHKYLNYMDAQLTELLTNYGKIAGIWFDGLWDKTEAHWRLARTYALIHKLQPAALIGGNHHLKPFAGEDFQMFEKDLPGQCTQEFNKKSTAISALPLEMCETMNDSWGYHSQDKNFKNTKDLIHFVVKAAGNNANFLLNIGPRPDGTIQPEFVKRLQKLGDWMKKNGESIYGTRGGPIAPQSWGVSTQKGNKIYLHILKYGNKPISLPATLNITRATLWPIGTSLTLQPQGDHFILNISADKLDRMDTIIELE